MKSMLINLTRLNNINIDYILAMNKHIDNFKLEHFANGISYRRDIGNIS